MTFDEFPACTSQLPGVEWRIDSSDHTVVGVSEAVNSRQNHVRSDKRCLTVCAAEGISELL
jgi:hypothetical protein